MIFQDINQIQKVTRKYEIQEVMEIEIDILSNLYNMNHPKIIAHIQKVRESDLSNINSSFLDIISVFFMKNEFYAKGYELFLAIYKKSFDYEDLGIII